MRRASAAAAVAGAAPDGAEGGSSAVCEAPAAPAASRAVAYDQRASAVASGACFFARPWIWKTNCHTSRIIITLELRPAPAVLRPRLFWHGETDKKSLHA